MIRVRLLDTALKAVSYEIDDLIGKEGEIVDSFGDTTVVRFAGGRVYDLPNNVLEEIENTEKAVKPKPRPKTQDDTSAKTKKQSPSKAGPKTSKTTTRRKSGGRPNIK